MDEFCFKSSEKQVDREGHGIETISKITTDVGQHEKQFEDDSAKAKLLLKQKTQLMKNAKFLIDQKKLLTTERDNVIKRVKGGSVNQSKISRVLDENARLTKELSAHLQSITTNIQQINEKMGHLAKTSVGKVDSASVNLSKEKVVPLSSHGSEAKQNINTKEIFDKITNDLKGQKFCSNRTQVLSKTEEYPQLEANVKSSYSEHKILGHTSQHTDQNHDVSPQGTFGNNGNQLKGQTGKEKQDVINEETTSTSQSYGSEGKKNEENTTSSNKFSIDEKIALCVLDKDKIAPNVKGTEIKESKGVLESVKDSISEKRKRYELDETHNNNKKTNRTLRDKNTYWCKKCNAFYTSVYGYVEHLESTSHFENVKVMYISTDLYK